MLARIALSVFTAVILLVAGAGCSATIVPPSNPADPVDVFVTDYGRHSSVILPTPVDQRTTYIEYAFGDYRWFALGDTKWYAIGSMISSGQSTLGRRQCKRPSMDSAESDIEFAHALDCDKLIRLRCDRQRAAKLADDLDARFLREAQNKGGTVHSDYSGLDHVKDSEGYCALHNCNHVTANWLRELGCEIHGFPVLSHYELSR